MKHGVNGRGPRPWDAWWSTQAGVPGGPEGPGPGDACRVRWNFGEGHQTSTGLRLWGGLCGDVFPRAFEGFWDFLRRFPNPSKIYGIVKNEDDYWYHVRFWAAISHPLKHLRWSKISKISMAIFLWYCAIQGLKILPTKSFPKDLGESLAVASQRSRDWIVVVTAALKKAPDEKSCRWWVPLGWWVPISWWKLWVGEYLVSIPCYQMLPGGSADVSCHPSRTWSRPTALQRQLAPCGGRSVENSLEEPWRKGGPGGRSCRCLGVQHRDT